MNRIGLSLVSFHSSEQNSALTSLRTDRLLMPCFGTASVYGMFDGMMDIISQLVLKWER